MTHWNLTGWVVDRGAFRLGPLDLALGPGEILAVIGRSGAGKTSLLRSVAGLARHHAGALERDGVAIGHRPPEERRAAYVPAGLGLFPHRSARENVAYAGRFAERPDPARLDRLLDRFGIRPFETRRPATLSDGERERVAAARALLSDPELLLWDEPLTALDQEARRDLLQALLDVARIDRVPTIVVSHDPEIAFTLADRFLLLDEGTPRFYGRPEGFLDHPPDAFSARFAGYENVWSRDDLAAAAAAEPTVRPWLARAGPGGLCFDAPLLSGPPRSDDVFRATVRRIVPRVPGFRIEATIGPLELCLAAPRGSGRSGFPRPGDAVPFYLPDDGVRAIGGARGAP